MALNYTERERERESDKFIGNNPNDVCLFDYLVSWLVELFSKLIEIDILFLLVLGFYFDPLIDYEFFWFNLL